MRLHDSLFAHLRQPVSALKLHIANCHPRASPHCRSLAKPTLQQQLQNAQRFSSNRQQRQRRSTRLNCSVPAAVSGNEEWSWKVSTAKRMLEFMGPALIIPLGDPLMSLTDTVFIGQCAGTRELAAMGPPNIVFSFSQYVFQALQIAAISLISDDLRKGLTKRAEHTFRVALALALMSGVAIMLLMEAAADHLIAGTGADPALVPLAAAYMRIRALAQPAVLLTMVLQSGLLAEQDSRTPALAVMLAVAVNIVSNVIAVGWLGLGLQGAAATTVATQIVGAGSLLFVAHRGSALKPSLSTRPSLDDVKAFAHTMGPLSVTYICKNLCYILLQTAAASLSLMQLAAHQAVFSVWNLLAFTTAPLEQTALTYIPAAATPWQRRSTTQIILAVAGLIGLSCGLIAAGVPLLIPQVLTKDPTVWVYMRRVAPLGCLAMLLTAADVGATGVLLARKDLGYVARAYVVTLCLLGVFMWCGVYKGGWGLDGVWSGLVFFFGLRCIQSMGRLLWMGDRQPIGSTA